MKLAPIAFALVFAAPALAQQAKPEPLWQAFAAVYDADAPITIQATIIRADWLEPKSVLWVRSSPDSTAPVLWRIETGAASLFTDTERALLEAGAVVRIRGYNTKDKTCASYCGMAGRDFTLATNEKITPKTGQGVCPLEQLLDETCAAARRPGPPPALQ